MAAVLQLHGEVTALRQELQHVRVFAQDTQASEVDHFCVKARSYFLVRWVIVSSEVGHSCSQLYHSFFSVGRSFRNSLSHFRRVGSQFFREGSRFPSLITIFRCSGPWVLAKSVIPARDHVSYSKEDQIVSDMDHYSV